MANLCLDVPLPKRVMGIDPAGPDADAVIAVWMDRFGKMTSPLVTARPDEHRVPKLGALTPSVLPTYMETFQAKSRLDRKPLTSQVVTTTTIEPMKNSKVDFNGLSEILKKKWADVDKLLAYQAFALDVNSSMRTADHFRKMYQGSFDMALMQYDPRNLPPIHGQRDVYRHPNFREAFVAAIEKDGGYLTMSSYLGDGEGYPSDVLGRWIWGPQGEFTGFARINLFDQLDRDVSGRRSIVASSRNNGYKLNWQLEMVPHINFTVSFLSLRDGRDRYGHPLDRDMSEMLIQFATYEDYVAWDNFAARYTTRRD